MWLDVDPKIGTKKTHALKRLYHVLNRVEVPIICAKFGEV